MSHIDVTVIREKMEKSLRESVYHYFCDQMKFGKLTAGEFVNQSEICEELNISKAPLRDALIQLEVEGFVNILPRRGVLINPLTLKGIQEAYDVVAAIESSAIFCAFDRIDEGHVDRMAEINNSLLQTLESGKFSDYYQLNIDFHNVFIDLAENQLFKKIIAPLRQRLYDFPLRNYDVEWEKNNLLEHVRLIDSIRKGNREAAASVLKHEHWSFSFQEQNIRRFYQL